MTKKLIVGIIVIISLALIVGYIAGSQHIPFSKSINPILKDLKKLIQF